MERMNYLWARNTGGLDGTQQCSLAFCFWLGKSIVPGSGRFPQSALLVYDEDMLQFLHIYRWNDLVPQEGRLLECPPFLVAPPPVWLKKDWPFLDHSFGCLDELFAEKSCESVITATIQCLSFLFPLYDRISSLPVLNIVAWITLIQNHRELFTSSEGQEVSRSQSFKRTIQSPASKGLHC